METSEIKVTGIAKNGKAGAILLTSEDEVYYIEGVHSWEEAIYNKKIEVTGKIQQETFEEEALKNEKGEYSQGMMGEKKTILSPTWKLIE